MFGKSTICLSILLLVNILVVPRFCLLWLELQIFLFKQFCKDTFLFLLNKELGVELLGQRVGICLPLEELAKLFSKVAFPLCISTHKVWVSVVPHPCHIFFQLFAVFFFLSLALLMGMWWYQISLMSNHVLFVHLYVFPWWSVCSSIFFLFHWVICLLLNSIINWLIYSDFFHIFLHTIPCFSVCSLEEA